MKPFDLSKFKKETTKSLKTVGTGFRDPSFWIDTGNYVLNYVTSGDFEKGLPLDGKFNLLVGPSGTGKSLLSFGVMGKYCQDHGVQIILLDTENAVDKQWGENFGLDLEDESKILRFSVSTLDDIAAIISGFVEQYKTAYADVPYEERQKILFIIDSLGMATTKVEQDQFADGDMKGDMGRKPKQLFSLCRNFLASCADQPIGVIATNHTYASQSIFKPEDVIAGGGSMEYAPSIIVALQKSKLKDEDNKDKKKDIIGIQVDATCRKTRYTKPFQKATFNIPWDSGLQKYSGLFELFTETLKYKGSPVIQKNGSYCSYYDLKTGEQVWNKYRKDITEADYDRIMKDWKEIMVKDSSNIDTTSITEGLEEASEAKTKKKKEA